MKLYNTYTATRAALDSGETSCLALTQHYLDAIEQKKHLNAFLEVYAEEALEAAKQIDEKLKQGTAGKLAGLVLGVKDNICWANHKVQAASKILEGFESKFTSTALQRLIDEDVIIIGRCNLDEFAMGASTENSAYGRVLNADDEKRVSGGSSGGSAVAVQAGLCHAALGSDTGGSVRQPAAFCGMVGYRPTYGAISRYGLLAYASSFDQIGPITQTVEDAEQLLSIMVGKDEMDATSGSYKHQFLFSEDKEPKKIGFLLDCINHPNVDPEIQKAFSDLRTQLEEAGHTIVDLSSKYTDYVVPTYYVLTTAEASSNLSRFAGMLYGFRSDKAKDIATTISYSRTEGFGDEVKRRIMLGTFVLSAGYYDAYYSKGQKVRRLVRDEVAGFFKQVDFIALPTTPGIAFEAGKKADPIAMYLEDIFAMHASLSGSPAISIPLKKHSTGMSMAVQLVADRNKDAQLLSFSKTIAKLAQ